MVDGPGPRKSGSDFSMPDLIQLEDDWHLLQYPSVDPKNFEWGAQADSSNERYGFWFTS